MNAGVPWLVLCSLLLPQQALAEAPPEGQAYAPGSFDSIEISGSATVRFTQGEGAEQVFVEGDDEAQKGVSLEVREGVLTIRPAGAWKFWNARRAQIQVTARALKRLNISGAADLLAAAPVQLGRLSVSISGAGLARFDQLKADQLSFQVSGAGDGQLAGSVGDLKVQVSGRSDFRGENLMAQRATVSVSGIADVRVWAVQDLGVSVSGIGTVDYWGTPTVRRHASGIAKVNDRGPKPVLIQR